MTSRFAAFATMLTTGVIALMHLPLALAAYGLRNTGFGLSINMTVNGIDLSTYADALLVYAVMAFSIALTVAIWAAAQYDALTEPGSGNGGAGGMKARGSRRADSTRVKRDGRGVSFATSPVAGWVGSSLER